MMIVNYHGFFRVHRHHYDDYSTTAATKPATAATKPATAATKPTTAATKPTTAATKPATPLTTVVGSYQ